MGPLRPHQSGLSSTELGFSLCLDTELFCMFHATEYHSLSGCMEFLVHLCPRQDIELSHAVTTFRLVARTVSPNDSAHFTQPSPSMSLISSRYFQSLSLLSRVVFQKGFRRLPPPAVFTVWLRPSMVNFSSRSKLRVSATASPSVFTACRDPQSRACPAQCRAQQQLPPLSRSCQALWFWGTSPRPKTQLQPFLPLPCRAPFQRPRHRPYFSASEGSHPSASYGRSRPPIPHPRGSHWPLLPSGSWHRTVRLSPILW